MVSNLRNRLRNKLKNSHSFAHTFEFCLKPTYGNLYLAAPLLVSGVDGSSYCHSKDQESRLTVL